MNKYEIIVEYLQEKVDEGILTLEEAEQVNDIAYNKYITEKEENEKEDDSKKKKTLKKIAIGTAAVGATAALGATYAYNKKSTDNAKTEITKGDLSYLKNKLKKLERDKETAFKKSDELSKTWNYKSGMNEINTLTNDINSIKKKISSYKDFPEKKELVNKLNSISSESKTKNNDLKKKNVKKQLNRFNNKYWIDYTKKHNEAFRETEKELLGHNTKAGMKHDMDKYFMYHVLPAPIAHALHVQFSRHHSKHARTKDDYVQMMIDWECNRKTKPDKQLKPYQIIDKFYPELKSTMIPILKEYGLPTNAREDKIYERKKKG